MRPRIALVLLAVFAFTSLAQEALAQAAKMTRRAEAQVLELPRTPSLSPDGTRLAFSHQGDLWVVPASGGLATRVTANDAYDGNPKWSHDGEWLAFQSNRHGNQDVFMMPAIGGLPTRLTWHSESEALHGWIDGDRVLMGATRDRNYHRRGQGLWVGYWDGRTPTIMGDFGARNPALSPDGKWVCYERGHGDPRRRAYRGAASSALWLFETETGEHRELTRFRGNDIEPMWSSDGQTIYFLSDRECEGNEGGRDLGLWQISAVGGRPQLVVHPGGRSLRYAEIARNADLITAELDSGLVVVDAKMKIMRPVTIRGSFDPSEPVEYERTVSGGASELAISPDGESIAFSAGGDVYVMRKHEKIRRSVRVTEHPDPDGNPIWVDEGKALLFVSERDGNAEVYRARPEVEDLPFYRARSFKIERVTESEADEFNLQISPDGERLAWIEGQGRLVVGDPNTLEVQREITNGFDPPDYSWSPDSRWLAYSKVDNDYNSEVFLALAAVEKEEGAEEDPIGATPINVSRHPDDDYSPVWSTDGRKLAFTSRRQMLDETDVYVTWLVKEDVEMNEQERLEAEDEKKNAKKKKKDEPKSEPEPGKDPSAKKKEEKSASSEQEPKSEEKTDEEEGEDEEKDEKKKKKVEPIQIDFEDLHRRVRRVTLREGNETVLGFSADSEKLYFNANVGTRLTTATEGESGFFEIGVRGDDESKLGSSGASSMTQHEKVTYYVRGGQIRSRASKEVSYSFSVTFRENRRALRKAVMEQGWRVLDRGFYDPSFHGHNWAGSLEKWQPLALGASTGEDFALMMNWMLGEMNASHMGFYGGGNTQAREIDRNSTAALGVLWDESYSGPGRRVREVIKGMPAHRDNSRLEIGDVVLAVNGRDYEEGDNWHRLMLGLSGEETWLTVKRGEGEDAEEVDVRIRPTAAGAMGGALYRRWTDQSRDAVEEKSGGRLGYIHIQAMGTASLLEFERDLYNAGYGKDVLLIDVRENGGGWTTDMVLSMLMVNDHAITVPRNGGQGYPQERRIFATWNKPIVVLCNENSYSNAEIFSWSIRTLKRGPIVGKETYGAVISTGGAGLLDGSFVRLPLRGWYVNDGTMTNMELNGCPPDYPVENLPGDYVEGVDRQLDKAIEVGLGLIES